ncbi:MAG: acetate--CoA ligase [Deinococcales bacterium]
MEPPTEPPGRFPPPAAFSAHAHVAGADAFERLYRRSLDDPEGFWGEAAAELHWFRRWERVLDWQEPHARWFVGGTTNLAYNCLDLQVERGHGDRVAFHWEGEPGDSRELTYRDLLRDVGRLANALKARGVGKGDRVAIFMPRIPETVVAMLACARIGAPHAVVFAGFSAQALAERIDDAQAKVVITADGSYRHGEAVPLKTTVDAALATCPSVRAVVVVRRAGVPVTMDRDRDAWYHDLLDVHDEACPAEPLDAEHPLFILYAAGSTGRPKGVLHTTGGYMTHAYLTSRLVFDLHDDDVYWCSADVGWVTGHSYIVYGPMCNGATQVLYEGAPTQPDGDRFWELIERHGVSVLGTTPTAIRAFRTLGETYPRAHDLSSLRLLATVGEPIDASAWAWYHHEVGGGRCPIVHAWWQAETGAIMLGTLPGAHDAKPGSAGVPMFGVDAAVVDLEGREVGSGEGGYLVLRRPWPGMLRGIYGDDDRYRSQYWGEIPHLYFTGDGARRDDDGYYWIMGRVDDVVSVSGFRLGTMEVESALLSHPTVAEAAVVGRPDEARGQAIVAFVTLVEGAESGDALKEELRDHVGREIGPIARPDDIRFTLALPKTRSGKIMRRLLRNVAGGGEATPEADELGERKAIRDAGHAGG